MKAINLLDSLVNDYSDFEVINLVHAVYDIFDYGGENSVSDATYESYLKLTRDIQLATSLDSDVKLVVLDFMALDRNEPQFNALISYSGSIWHKKRKQVIVAYRKLLSV